MRRGWASACPLRAFGKGLLMADLDLQDVLENGLPDGASADGLEFSGTATDQLIHSATVVGGIGAAPKETRDG